MKPNENKVKTAGGLPGEEIAMGFDPKAAAHLMGLLSGLYEDRILACIREYTTNGWDAQLVVGVTRPVEITLPSALAPFLRVKDFGVGLDREGIKEVYSLYGASTKRNSDEYNGMLGIGCKAALSYSQQFTVVGIKDGIKTMVAITRTRDGGGSMKIVSQTPSDEPSGVTVEIPVRTEDASDFAETAAEFFSYWPEGSVLVNGKQPERVKLKRVTDRVFTETKEGYGGWGYGHNATRDRIVMGNVAYPCRIPVDLPNTERFVCYVNMGEVGFVPSREALDDFAETKATIKALADEYAKHINDAAEAEVQSAATPADALVAAVQWTRAIPHNIRRPLSYKGEEIPRKFYEHQTVLVSNVAGNLGSATTTTMGIDPAHLADAVIVTGFTPSAYTAQHKRKMLMWRTEHISNPDTIQRFVMVSGNVPSKWVRPSHVVDYADIAALKLPSASVSVNGVTKRLTGSYDVIYADGSYKYEVTANDLVGKSLLWLHGNTDAGRRVQRRMVSANVNSYDVIVCLPKNRIEKFKRDFPQAVKTQDHHKKAFDTYVKSLSKDQKVAYSLRQGGIRQVVRGIDPAKVKDPAIKAAVKQATLNIDSMVKRLEAFTYLGHHYSNTEKAVDPMRPYPLFDERLCARDPQHVFDYLNDAYARRSA